MSSNNIDSIFNEIAGMIIQYYRLEEKLSLEDVTKKMNKPVSRQAIFKYENNLARMKNDVFEDICHALNKDPEVIYQEIDNYTKLKKVINNLKKINIDLIDNNINIDQALDLCSEEFKKLKNSGFKFSDSAIGKQLYDELEEQYDNINYKSNKEIDKLYDFLKYYNNENNIQSQNELLFSKNKDILTESDWNIINAIIEQRKKEIDKELGED